MISVNHETAAKYTTFSISPSMSPIPKSLEMKGLVLNSSKLSICSPVPEKSVQFLLLIEQKKRENIKLKAHTLPQEYSITKYYHDKTYFLTS